jgi:hypothetical protein
MKPVYPQNENNDDFLILLRDTADEVNEGPWGTIRIVAVQG